MAATVEMDVGIRAGGTGGEDSFSWLELYASLGFLVAIWVAGKVAVAVRTPGLVGQILAGIVLGPNLLAIVPKVGAFKMVGEIGLMLLVVEAGLEVDVEMLRLVGIRGALVAVFGSLIPLAMGFMIGWFALGLELEGSFVVGASFAPTSMGIALDVLKTGRLLNTPMGQLVIAAAVLDDIIALVLLSELEALQVPSSWAFTRPVVVAILLLVGFGFFAVNVVPSLMHRFLYPRVPNAHQGNVTLGLIFFLTLALAPFVRFVGSSPLLGCFIAGLCFATEELAHPIWNQQVKRLLTWFLRIFFAATIGFEIPIKSFVDPTILLNALLMMVCILGKLAMGVFAKPLNTYNALTVAFAMSSWGEFAFIVVLYGRDAELINQDLFASIVLAILVSVILSPILLRFTIDRYAQQAKRTLEAAKTDTGELAMGSPPLYYFVQSISAGRWGQQGALLHAIFELGLSIIDMRTFHPKRHNLDAKVVYEIYLKDPKHVLPHAIYRNPPPDQDSLIQRRLNVVYERVRHALDDPDGVLRVGRWFAGIEDNGEATDTAYRLAQQNLEERSVLTVIKTGGDDGGEHLLDGFVHSVPFDVHFADFGDVALNTLHDAEVSLHGKTRTNVVVRGEQQLPLLSRTVSKKTLKSTEATSQAEDVWSQPSTNARPLMSKFRNRRLSISTAGAYEVYESTMLSDLEVGSESGTSHAVSGMLARQPSLVEEIAEPQESSSDIESDEESLSNAARKDV